jgi:hypothetical protein
VVHGIAVLDHSHNDAAAADHCTQRDTEVAGALLLELSMYVRPLCCLYFQTGMDSKSNGCVSWIRCSSRLRSVLSVCLLVWVAAAGMTSGGCVLDSFHDSRLGTIYFYLSAHCQSLGSL